jgi:membrane-bound ClpP family serine protease
MLATRPRDLLTIIGACLMVDTKGTRRNRERRRTLGVLFNDLVGTGKDRGRDCKAARVRGLEVDDKLEFGRAGSGPLFMV